MLQGDTYKHDLHVTEVPLCLGPALRAAHQPPLPVTEEDALAWFASSIAALPEYVTFWDPEVSLNLSCLGHWQDGQLSALTSHGRRFMLSVLNALAHLRTQHTHAGNPFKELCRAFQRFRTGQQWQQICESLLHQTPLTSWHLQVLAQSMLDRHLRAVYCRNSALHASEPADISPITPMQAAVAYYCGGWAIRTTLQALCRLKHPDQPLIEAFRQTFTTQPEQADSGVPEGSTDGY